MNTWHETFSGAEASTSLAGWWFALVSLPIYQFLFLRWYYRLFIWARFLWHVSRIDLELIATHPDRSAGLGFLSNVTYAFSPLLFGQSVLLGGAMANRIFYAGARLPDFKLEIVTLIGLALVYVLLPLMVFSPQLAQAKRKARREYGSLAQKYVREFDQKWLRGHHPASEKFVGSGDIQSLADLGNSYQVITEMRWVPFTTSMVIHLAVISLIPLSPLVLTVIPFNELVDRFINMVF